MGCDCEIDSTDSDQKNVLIILLAINGTMFVLELVIGILAQSAALIADGLDMLTDATVIDVGCGAGTLTIWLKQQYPSARIIGLDADPAILEYARTKARAAGVDIEFVDGYANALPFDDESAERVVSNLFFHHLQSADKRSALSEALRILSPDGELHISDWGAPANLLMHALFFPVRVLDGFPNTRDNVKGRLPGLAEEAGARRVEQHSGFNTMFGTLRLFQATK